MGAGGQVKRSREAHGSALMKLQAPSAEPGPAPFMKYVLIFKKQSFPAKTNFKGINAQRIMRQ